MLALFAKIRRKSVLEANPEADLGEEPEDKILAVENAILDRENKSSKITKKS